MRGLIRSRAGTLVGFVCALLLLASCSSSSRTSHAIKLSTDNYNANGIRVRPPQVVMFALELFDVSSAATVDRVDVQTSSGEVIYKEARASFLRSKRYPHRNGYAGGACLSHWPARDYTILQPMKGLKLDPGDKFALMGFFEVGANAPSELTIDRFTIHFADGSTFVHPPDRGTKAKLEVVKSKADPLVCNGGTSDYVS